MLHKNQIAAAKRHNFKAAGEIEKQIGAIVAGQQEKAAQKKTPTAGEIMQKAADRAFRGGLAGMAAMVLQVCTLMWMRTTMNYQYRYGVTTREALNTLYKQGGVKRFYAGLA